MDRAEAGEAQGWASGGRRAGQRGGADLLHVDAAAPDVGGDEHARVARAELGHDGVALLLRHVAVHGGDCEVGLTHLVGQPVDLVRGKGEVGGGEGRGGEVRGGEGSGAEVRGGWREEGSGGKVR